MAIKFYTDRIQIGDFTLSEGNGGLQFDGVARAENFKVQGHFQGDSVSYAAGGYSAGVQQTNFIDSFNMAAESAAIRNSATLSQSISSSSGASSKTHGYRAGGSVGPPGNTNTIQKFPFATDTSGNDVGDLLNTVSRPTGQSSTTHGYMANGYSPPGAGVNTIQKYSFATDANASDVGDLGITNGGRSGHSSPVSGYAAAGGPAVTQIDKFPFATDSNSIDVGDLTQGRYNVAGCSSEISGYVVGGGYAPKNTIDKFPFATNSNATDVGDHGDNRWNGAGTGSRTTGYFFAFGPVNKSIRKFSFQTDGNSTGTITFNPGGAYRGSVGSEGNQI
jgi:hypothetical protein